ncbi:MAG: DUF4340 domain-containing protein, partial [Planctomycetes bacterium]|nr:DUF4340 domain-containing protein [Planctomycetota bacterium]
MRFKTTLILFAAAGLLLGFIFFVDQKNESTDDLVKREEGKRLLPDIGWNDSKKLEIKTATLDLALEKLGEPSDWQLVRPVKFPADKSVVDAVVNTFEFLAYKAVVSPEAGKPIDLALYGLATPEATLTLAYEKDKVAKSVVIKFGNKTAIGDYIYVMVEGKPDVYCIEPALRRSLDKPFPDWRDKSLARFEPWEAEKLIVAAGATEIEFAKKDDHWRVVRPFADRSDDKLVGDLLAQLKEFKAEEFVKDDTTDWAAYGLDQPGLRFTVFAKGKDQGTTVAIGNSPADAPARVYARNLANDTVLSVKSEIVAKLTIDPLAYRSRSLLELDTAKVVKLVLEKGGESVAVLAKDKDMWKMEKPADYPLDLGTISNFLTKVRDLKIAEFAAENAGELAGFGLEQPYGAIVLALPGKDEKAPAEELRISLGVVDGKPDTVYARKNGEERVVGLAREVVSWIDRGPLNFRNRSMLQLQREKIDSVSIETDGKTATVVRGKENAWTLEGAEPAAPNMEFLQDMLDHLCWLRAGELLVE